MKTIPDRFKKFRTTMLNLLVDKTKPLYIRWFKKSQLAWNQSITTLKNYAPNTLGWELGCFLEKEGFELIPKLEDHDVLHVLLKYKTTIEDEVRMQFFLLGNRKRSVYALFTAILGSLVVPEGILSFIKEYQKGRRCINISNWDFEHLLSEPTAQLRKQIFQKQLKGQKLIF